MKSSVPAGIGTDLGTVLREHELSLASPRHALKLISAPFLESLHGKP
jgi:hypothetical protein